MAASVTLALLLVVLAKANGQVSSTAGAMGGSVGSSGAAMMGGAGTGSASSGGATAVGETGGGSMGSSGALTPNGDCACTTNYAPVCGTDNTTYANSCQAECQLGAGSWVKGKCASDWLNPVAGCIGNARCAGSPCDEPWPEECQNPLLADAQCFLNPCTDVEVEGVALPACSAIWVDPATGQQVRCGGPVTAPLPACSCTKEYSPVCGSNGKTYPNKCMAECELGADGNWVEGSCDDLNPLAGCLGNVRCKRNACSDACPAASAGSVCFQNTCTGQSLNGADVEPCAAIWVDPTTRHTAVCGGGDAPVQEPPEAVSCPSGATVACLLNPCSVKPPPDCAAASEPGATCEASYCTDGTLPDGTKVPPCTAVWRSASGSLSVCPSTGTSAPTNGSKGCMCPMIHAPVCGADNKTYGNACEAGCAGVKVGSTGKCSAEGPSAGEGCMCPMIYKPVCGVDNKTYSNDCEANCANVKVATSGSCPDDKASGADDGCACTMMYAPVCGVDGKTYGNDCEAGCAGVAVAWQGECPPPPIECAAGSTVQCFADPCRVSSCPAFPSATCIASYCSNATYRGNHLGPCEALFVDAGGNRLDCSTPPADRPGEVKDVHDCPLGSPRVMCMHGLVNACDGATCPANPGATCISKVCGATYRGTLVPPCSPIWFDAKTGDLVDCSKPTAIPSTAGAVAKIGDCPAGSPRVLCPVGMADACKTATCPASPGATCISKVCASTYKGVQLPSCAPIWYNRTTGDLVNCSKTVDSKPGPVKDINLCPAGSPRVMCAAGLADACKTATCPGRPSATCMTKVCAATYRGVELLPCSPIWYNKTSGDLVDCAVRPACSSCSLDYEPVCGQDGNTYPSKCTADCLGVKIKKTGKCYHCNGSECTIGKKNDLCVLGSQQCWAKKYSCQAPAGGKAGDFLGKCLPKPSTKKSSQHHHHHRHMLEAINA